MSRDKQIEETVIALTESQHEFDKAWHECLHNNGKQPERENVFYAKYLVENKGYVKASEVAREVIEKIESAIDQTIQVYNTIATNTFDSIEQAKARASKDALQAICDYLAELEKTYTVGEKE